MNLLYFYILTQQE